MFERAGVAIDNSVSPTVSLLTTTSWTTQAPCRPVSGNYLYIKVRYNVIVQISSGKELEVRQIIHDNKMENTREYGAI